jgi:hypothetical protein
MAERQDQVRERNHDCHSTMLFYAPMTLNKGGSIDCMHKKWLVASNFGSVSTYVALASLALVFG